MRAHLVVVVFWLAGCLESQTLQCENGLTCPLDQQCDLAHDACVDADQLRECAGMPDKTECSTVAAPEGTCDQGVCLAGICGDGVLQGLEECDDGAGAMTCAEFGYYDPVGTVACRADCTYERAPASSGCTGYCGDGEVRVGPELCDGNDPPIGCVDLGYGAGHLACNAQTCGPLLDDCKLFGWAHTQMTGKIREVHGTADNAVFAVVQNKQAAEYFDGLQWRPIPLTSCPLQQLTTFTGLWAVAPDVAFATVNENVVLRLTPTGCTPLAITALGMDVWGASPTDVYVVSSAGIHHYDGTSWTVVNATSRTRIWGSATNDIWASSANTVMHFDGTNWSSPITLGGLSMINALWGTSATDVYAAGQGPTNYVYRYNGSWAPILTSADNDQTAYSGTVANGHPIVGFGDGSIRSYDGTRWSVVQARGVYDIILALWTAPTSGNVLAGIFGAPLILTFHGSTRVDFAPRGGGDRMAVKRENEIYVVDRTDAENGGLWRWDGFQWQLESNAGMNPSDVWVDPVSGTVRVVVAHTDGAGGGMRTRTGSNAWTTIAAGVAGERIWGAATTDYWVLAGDLDEVNNIVLRHFVNDVQVACASCPPARDMYDLWGTSTSNVFFVGSGGKIYRWNGTSVVETATGTTENITSVRGSPDGQHIWVGGNNGVVLHWNGTSWDPLTPPNTAAPILSIWGTSPSDLFVGQIGVMYHFDGQNWSPVDAQAPGFIRDMESRGDSLYYLDSVGVPSSLHSIVRTRPW